MPLPESNLERIHLIQTHIERLRHLLEDFSDEIPEQWMSGSEGSQYKVKMGWWQPLIDTLDLVNMQVITHPDLKEEIDSFIEEYAGSGITQRGTKEEDIKKANALLKKVIKNLQNSV